MKIILVSFSGRGALGQYLHLMGKGFKEHLGSNVVLSAPSNFHYKDMWNGSFLKIGEQYNTVSEKIHTVLNPKTTYRYFGALKKENPNVIHVVGGEYHPWIVILWIYCKFFSNCRLIMTVHDPEAHSGAFRDYLLLLLRKGLLKFSDKIHFLSVSKLYEKYKKRGKAFIVEHGSFQELFSPSTEEERVYDFTFLGRLEYYKGIDLFVKAASALSKKSEKKLSILIGGPGAVDKQTEYIITKNSIFEYRNTYLSDEDFGMILSQTKNLVLPYRHVTQSSLPLIANYFGCRCVASNLGDFENIIQKLDGVLFESENTDSLENALLFATQLGEYKSKNMDSYLFKNQFHLFYKHYISA